jgi:hypothetical protein
VGCAQWNGGIGNAAVMVSHRRSANVPAMPRTLFPDRVTTLRHVEDGFREVGILLFALAPLDYAFAEGSGRAVTTALFLGAGVVFFCVGLMVQAWRSNGS